MKDNDNLIESAMEKVETALNGRTQEEIPTLVDHLHRSVTSDNTGPMAKHHRLQEELCKLEGVIEGMGMLIRRIESGPSLSDVNSIPAAPPETFLTLAEFLSTGPEGIKELTKTLQKHIDEVTELLF